jgi:DNA-binding NtrC family response regulator
MAVNMAKSILRHRREQSTFPPTERIADFKDIRRLGLSILDEIEKEKRINREEMENFFIDYSSIAALSFGEEKFWLNLFRLFIEYFCMSKTHTLKELMGNLERSIIIRVLAKFSGNQKDTARFLGMKYTTLNEKVKKYNICFRKEPCKYS